MLFTQNTFRFGVCRFDSLFFFTGRRHTLPTSSKDCLQNILATFEEVGNPKSRHNVEASSWLTSRSRQPLASFSLGPHHADLLPGLVFVSGSDRPTDNMPYWSIPIAYYRDETGISSPLTSVVNGHGGHPLTSLWTCLDAFASAMGATPEHASVGVLRLVLGLEAWSSDSQRRVRSPLVSATLY